MFLFCLLISWATHWYCNRVAALQASRGQCCSSLAVCAEKWNMTWDAGLSPGQHLSHQVVGLLSLHLQLLRPLSDQILQVGGVLLQHPQHRVNDVGLLSLRDALELSDEEDRKQLATFRTDWDSTEGGADLLAAYVVTCLKISSKLGLLSGSSLQPCFITCITSKGASSTDTTGRHKGGGSLTLLMISVNTSTQHDSMMTQGRWANSQVHKNWQIFRCWFPPFQ